MRFIWGTNWVDVFNQLQNYPLFIIFQGKQSRCCIRWRTLTHERPVTLASRGFPRAWLVTFVWWSLLASLVPVYSWHGAGSSGRAGQKVTTDLLQVINPAPAPHLIWQFAPWFPVWQPGGQLLLGSAEHYVWPGQRGGAGVTSVFKAQRISVNISRAGTMHARDTRLDLRDS